MEQREELVKIVEIIAESLVPMKTTDFKTTESHLDHLRM